MGNQNGGTVKLRDILFHKGTYTKMFSILHKQEQSPCTNTRSKLSKSFFDICSIWYCGHHFFSVCHRFKCRARGDRMVYVYIIYMKRSQSLVLFTLWYRCSNLAQVVVVMYKQGALDICVMSLSVIHLSYTDIYYSKKYIETKFFD